MASGGPTTIGVSDRQIDRGGLLFFPDGARNLFAVQQVMLDAGEDAAPVTTVDRLVNDAANLYIDSVTTQNPVVDSTRADPAAGTVPSMEGSPSALMVVSPDFRFVLLHGA